MHSIRARSTSAREVGRFWRNSCSGGSSRRIVTGRPAIASNRPSKSSCWSGSSSASASRRSSSSSAMIIARIFGWRSSAMNMCSVRHRPMPSAPSSRAFFAPSRVVGVGAHLQAAELVGPLEHAVEVLVHARVDQRHVVERDAALRAVDGDEVALVDRRAVDRDRLGAEVDLQRARAHDRRAAHPARDQRRVRRLAALAT